ncbi:hemerythrin domain-containing protein [soil metagenome]
MSSYHAMTRSENALSMLTRDHDEVISACRQFAALNSAALSSKKKLADEICFLWTVHATVEQEIFYPAVRRHVPDGDALVDDMLPSHERVMELISQILEMSAEDPFFDSKMESLSSQIVRQARDHETGIFVEACLAKIDLVALGKEIAVRKSEFHDSVSNFWPIWYLQGDRSLQQAAA